MIGQATCDPHAPLVVIARPVTLQERFDALYAMDKYTDIAAMAVRVTAIPILETIVTEMNKRPLLGGGSAPFNGRYWVIAASCGRALIAPARVRQRKSRRSLPLVIVRRDYTPLPSFVIEQLVII